MDIQKFKYINSLAGKGSRFQQQGYLFPKPLIEVNSKPMIQKVVEIYLLKLILSLYFKRTCR